MRSNRNTFSLVAGSAFVFTVHPVTVNGETSEERAKIVQAVDDIAYHAGQLLAKLPKDVDDNLRKVITAAADAKQYTPRKASPDSTDTANQTRTPRRARRCARAFHRPRLRVPDEPYVVRLRAVTYRVAGRGRVVGPFVIHGGLPVSATRSHSLCPARPGEPT